MRRLFLLEPAILLLTSRVHAQQGSGTTANPVTASAQAYTARYGTNMAAAAEAMPADKYAFKQTPEMMTYSQLVLHIADSNYLLCSGISGMPSTGAKLTATDTKDKLVGTYLDAELKPFVVATSILRSVLLAFAAYSFWRRRVVRLRSAFVAKPVSGTG